MYADFHLHKIHLLSTLKKLQQLVAQGTQQEELYESTDVKAPGLWLYVWMVEGSLQPCLLCACTMHSYLPTPALAFFITHTMFCKAIALVDFVAPVFSLNVLNQFYHNSSAAVAPSLAFNKQENTIGRLKIVKETPSWKKSQRILCYRHDKKFTFCSLKGLKYKIFLQKR